MPFVRFEKTLETPTPQMAAGVGTQVANLEPANRKAMGTRIMPISKCETEAGHEGAPILGEGPHSFHQTRTVTEAPPRSISPLDDMDVARLASLGLMNAGIAHDLCNMLQIAASAVRLIERGMDADLLASHRPNLRCALDAITRAGALGRRAVESSRAEALPCEIIDLESAIAGMGHLIALAVGPTIIVELISAGDVPPVVCNRLELENAVLNLVVNARDAMPTGGRLTLSVYRENSVGGNEPAECRAVLSVRDTGCGMTEKIAQQIFRPFFTTKANGRGTGLGLAMVGSLLRRLGGSAEVESELGKGTAIILRLPACDRHPSA